MTCKKEKNHEIKTELTVDVKKKQSEILKMRSISIEFKWDKL